jgi:regulator of protease activity HflC (stomatin/prohibitin superfamily)
MSPKRIVLLSFCALLGLVLLIGGCQCIKTVPAGHVGVATLYGDVVEDTYVEGLHFPVNPLYKWDSYDVREKSLNVRKVPMPTSDQQISLIDISVQYRINQAACPSAKSNVGLVESIVAVKIEPNIRSLLRSEGKAVSRCEDLFNDSIQQAMQVNLAVNLQKKVGDYAIVTAVLIRNIELPEHIRIAIKNKKVREQRAEEQKAELARFKTEQEQQIAVAAAERLAADETAAMKRTLADAEAYEIEKINMALADSPAYIRLRALETLERMADGPATKIYFLNGDSPTPLPLMHLGETGAVTK